LGKGVRTGAQHGYEERGRQDIAAMAVVDWHRWASPIDESLFAGMMFLPHHHVLIAMPPLVQFAETTDMCCNTCQSLCGGRIYVARSFESRDSAWNR
jgi:hypothetical protein